MTKEKIWLSSPHMGGAELEYVKEAFETNWISPVGPHIKAFEEELAAYNGISHCAALSSGTAAIHLALIILGVKAGDEVFCSSFTFSGTCNPIAYLNAVPVFIDSEPDTWNMDPALLELAINERKALTGRLPKAIIVVHLYGMPAKIDAIMAIGKKYGIPVIEDAAEALGASYKGRKLGTYGDLGVYSFNGNKIITTSGGGALVSAHKEWIDRARFLATQAREPAVHYEHKEIGYNYRLSNVCAGIGRGQLKVLDERVNQRRAVNSIYRENLGHHSAIRFLTEPGEDFFSNYWLTTVLFSSQEQREEVRLALEAENIESRPLWKPMHLQPVFMNYPSYKSGVAEKLFDKGLCLPSGSNLLLEEQERVLYIINAFLA